MFLAIDVDDAAAALLVLRKMLVLGYIAKRDGCCIGPRIGVDSAGNGFDRVSKKLGLPK